MLHNSKVGRWGLDICKRRLREAHQRPEERDITDRMISEFIGECPACQVMSRMRLQIKAHRFTCALYNPFEVLHLDNIASLTKDGNELSSMLSLEEWNCSPQSRRQLQKQLP